MNALNIAIKTHNEITDTRTKRQWEVIVKWLEARAKGTLQAGTGFGKTRVALEAIKLFRRTNGERSVLIIVPTIALRNQWTTLLREWKLKDYSEVVVINSIIKRQPYDVDLLIVDEVHKTAADTFKRLFDVIGYDFILGLTATFQRLDNKHELLKKYAPIIDDIPMRTAKKEGWTSNYKHYNLGITLSEEDKVKYNNMTEMFGRAMDKFGRDFDLMRKCSYSLNPTDWGGEPYVVQYAKSLDWRGNNPRQAFNNITLNKGKKAKERVSIWGNDHHQHNPKSLYIWAIIGMRVNRQMMKFLYEHPSKTDIAIDIIKAFNKRTITFGQYISTAKTIADAFPDISVFYHSKMQPEMRKTLVEKEYKKLKTAEDWVKTHKSWTIKHKRGKIFVQTYKNKKVSAKTLKEEALHKIKNYKKTKVVATAKALDEGIDVPNLEMGIVLARSSSQLTETQRLGRVCRKHTFADGSDKEAIFIDIYLKDTKDEVWLKKSQTGFLGQIWIESVNDIK